MDGIERQIHIGTWLAVTDVAYKMPEEKPLQVRVICMGQGALLTGEQAIALRKKLISAFESVVPSGRRTEPTVRARITSVFWSADGGRYHGEVKNLSLARAAVGEVRKRVGQVKAVLTVKRFGGGSERVAL